MNERPSWAHILNIPSLISYCRWYLKWLLSFRWHINIISRSLCILSSSWDIPSSKMLVFRIWANHSSPLRWQWQSKYKSVTEHGSSHSKSDIWKCLKSSSNHIKTKQNTSWFLEEELYSTVSLRKKQNWKNISCLSLRYSRPVFKP